MGERESNHIRVRGRSQCIHQDVRHRQQLGARISIISINDSDGIMDPNPATKTTCLPPKLVSSPQKKRSLVVSARQKNFSTPGTREIGTWRETTPRLQSTNAVGNHGH